MKDYLPLITVLASVIFAIITSFNKQQETGELLQDEYFKTILLAYYEVRKVRPDINAIEYINKFKFKKYCIPSYIYYVADQDDEEKLRKLLLVDYWDNYPTIINNTNKVMDKFFKIVYFLFNILLMLMIVALLYLITTVITAIFTNLSEILNNGYIKIYIGILIISLAFFIVILVFKNNIISFGKDIDQYSMDIKTIKKIVVKKEKIYKQRKNKYYL